ncbi:MAG: hypothetical protein ACLPTQ_07625, partial [Terriglobales bacterium]
SGGDGVIADWARDIEDGAGGNCGLAGEMLLHFWDWCSLGLLITTIGRIRMPQSLSEKKKVAVLGVGKIGSILLQSFLLDGLQASLCDITYGTICGPEH